MFPVLSCYSVTPRLEESFLMLTVLTWTTVTFMESSISYPRPQSYTSGCTCTHTPAHQLACNQVKCCRSPVEWILPSSLPSPSAVRPASSQCHPRRASSSQAPPRPSPSVASLHWVLLILHPQVCLTCLLTSCAHGDDLSLYLCRDPCSGLSLQTCYPSSLPK
jgi:hypothetical protein